jgi:magnesium transporter
MLTIYKTIEGQLLEQQQVEKGTWINAIDPTPAEIERLLGHGLSRESIQSALDINELARVEKEDEGLFLIIRVPYFFGDQVDVPYTTVPLGIFLGQDLIVTICQYNNELIRQTKRGNNPLDTRKHNVFVLHALYNTAKLFLEHLASINAIVDNLEDRLIRSIRNQELLYLLKYQKSLVFFSTALKTNELMLERLQKLNLFKKYPDDEDLLEDVLTETMQALEMTSISGSILNQMMDAFASIISNNQNNVIKVLTSATIVMSLPALISGIYGMNVPLPFQSHPAAIWFTMGLSVVLVIGAIILFRKRDWF